MARDELSLLDNLEKAIRHFNRMRQHRFWLGILVAVLAIVTTGQTAWYSHEQQKCNEAFARNLAFRVQWQNEDREALNRLIVTVFTRDSDTAQHAAYEHWRQVTEANERSRDAQPLPDLAGCD